MSVTQSSALGPIAPGQVRLRLHGPDTGGPERADEVSAALFAIKLGTLVRALQAADRAVNGSSAHIYNIFRLASSVPTVTLTERLGRRRLFGSRSGVAGFEECVEAVTSGDVATARLFGKCAGFVGQLGKGARRTFGYGEVWTSTEKVFRLDEYLVERSAALSAPERYNQIAGKVLPGWFTGTAYGSFDGQVRAVDLRGALPEVKLVLTAGGKQIDCVFREDDVETLRSALNRRVRVTGRAIYDGRSGLPRRIDQPTIVALDEKVDFSRWRGAFEPFEAASWEDNE